LKNRFLRFKAIDKTRFITDENYSNTSLKVSGIENTGSRTLLEELIPHGVYWVMGNNEFVLIKE
jgi:hypothetical protein